MGKHVLEYVIKLTDATGRAINSASSRLNAFLAVVKAVMAKVGAAIKGAGAHFASFAASVGRNLANIKAGLDMALGTVQRFAGMFQGAIMEAFRFEKAVANFKTLLGSVDTAKRHIEDLRKFAAATPLTFDDLQQASRLMLSFGMSVDTIMPNLKMLGDIAMGDRAKFQGLALVFSQIKAAGRLMGQDLLQMINQGFNPLTVISEKTGVSMVDLKKLMESGAIGFDMVEAAMKAATSEGGRFNNAMKDCATTGEGLISTLQDNWTDAVRTFGNELLDVAKGGIQWCINKLQELRDSGVIQEWAEKAKTAIYSVIGAFNGLSDASTRAEVWGAVKDVLVGAFEEGAKGAATLITKAAPLVGSLIAKGFKAVAFGSEERSTAEKQMHAEVGNMSRAEISAKYGRSWAYDWTDAWKAELDRREKMLKSQTAERNAAEVSNAMGAGTGESRLDRGLRVLRSFGEKSVRAANELGKTPLTPNANAPSQSKPADLSSMLSNATGGDDSKTLREAKKQADAAARAQEKADREVARLRQKAWKEYVRNMESDLRRVEKVRDDASARLADAKSYSEQAWGFYRDRDSLRDYDARQDADLAARDQYVKDYHSLTHGVNADRFSHLKYLARNSGSGAVEEQLAEWRKKKTISLDTEAAMRVGVADDQERLAYKYAEETAKNTAQMAASLKQITEGAADE